METHGTVIISKLVMILIKKKMKKHITFLTILISGFALSQVTIGKSAGTIAPVNANVSIEFGDATGGVKGIVLPWVTAPADVTGAVPGTLIFDSGATQQKVRLARANVANSPTVFEWFDFSNGALLPTTASAPDAGTDVSTAKALINTTTATDATPGILVLGDTNKAMVLPRVSAVADIVNPSAGMMVYVTGTSNGTGPNANQLAVFNGREWSFWTKP